MKFILKLNLITDISNTTTYYYYYYYCSLFVVVFVGIMRHCHGMAKVLPNFQFKTNVAKMDIVGDKCPTFERMAIEINMIQVYIYIYVY